MKERNKQLDDLRGWAMVLMLLGHSLNFTFGENGLWHLIYAFHMPLFFLVSGTLLSEDAERINITRLARKVLVPYFVAGAVITLLQGLTKGNWMYGVSLLLTKTGMPLLLQNWKPAIGPIWFLPSFLFSFVYYKLLSRWCRQWTGLILAVLFELSLSLSRLYGMLPFGMTQAFGGALFLYMGHWAMRDDVRKDLRSWQSCLFGGLVLAYCIWQGNLIMVNHIYKLHLLQCVGAAYASLFLYRLVKFIPCRGIQFLGEQSLWVLCFHTIDYKMGWSYRLVSHFTHDRLMLCIAMLIAELLFAGIATYLYYLLKKWIQKRKSSL